MPRSRYSLFIAFFLVALAVYFWLRSTDDVGDMDGSSDSGHRAQVSMQRGILLNLETFRRCGGDGDSLLRTYDGNTVHIISYGWIFSETLNTVEYSSFDLRDLRRVFRKLRESGIPVTLHLRLHRLSETPPRTSGDDLVSAIDRWIEDHLAVADAAGIEAVCIDLQDPGTSLDDETRIWLLSRARERFHGELSTDDGALSSRTAAAVYEHCAYVTWIPSRQTALFDSSAFAHRLDSIAFAAKAIHKPVLVVLPQPFPDISAGRFFFLRPRTPAPDRSWSLAYAETATPALISQPWLRGIVFSAEEEQSDSPESSGRKAEAIRHMFHRIPQGRKPESTIGPPLIHPESKDR